jgi:hypothetical protein
MEDVIIAEIEFVILNAGRTNSIALLIVEPLLPLVNVVLGQAGRIGVVAKVDVPQPRCGR